MEIVVGVAILVISTIVLAALALIWRRFQRWNTQQERPDDDIRIH